MPVATPIKTECRRWQFTGAKATGSRWSCCSTSPRNVLPHACSIKTGKKSDIEEEQWVLYVGRIRAMDHLLATTRQKPPSRFLRELPEPPPPPPQPLFAPGNASFAVAYYSVVQPAVVPPEWVQRLRVEHNRRRASAVIPPETSAHCVLPSQFSLATPAHNPAIYSIRCVAEGTNLF